MLATALYITVATYLIIKFSGQGRTDDNEESLRKRVETYNNQTLPIIQHYEKLGLVKEVPSDKSPDEVGFFFYKCVPPQLSTYFEQIFAFSFIVIRRSNFRFQYVNAYLCNVVVQSGQRVYCNETVDSWFPN